MKGGFSDIDVDSVSLSNLLEIGGRWRGRVCDDEPRATLVAYDMKCRRQRHKMRLTILIGPIVRSILRIKRIYEATFETGYLNRLLLDSVSRHFGCLKNV